MEFVVVLLGVVVVGLLVVLVLTARANVRAARRPQAPQATSQELPVEQLVRMQHEMLASERRRGTEELRGTQTAIDHQVTAMREELARLNRLVEETERDRREHVGELTSQLQAAGRQTQVLAETTQSLREALSSTTARGQWGERMAEDVLQLAGFVDGVNYRRHQPLTGSGGIPDYTFLLPQGLTLHMDVKFPLNNYLRVTDATSDVEREHARKEFLKDVRLRLREVTRREYVDPAGGTVDCVLLFIPNEQVYAYIQEQDRSILDDALRAKVVFCSPLTLFAVLAVIRQAVDNFQLSRTSLEILERLQGFEKQWDRFVEQMDKVGRNLKTASNAFEELEGTRRRGVERELERIDTLRRDQVAAPHGAGESPSASVGVLPLALEG
ncbi:MAG TPA: DNA recombination protein RmuC [Acidimicrobiia bacterium]